MARPQMKNCRRSANSPRWLRRRPVPSGKQLARLRHYAARTFYLFFAGSDPAVEFRSRVHPFLPGTSTSAHTSNARSQP